jgi:hypothetical protein
LKYFLRSHLPSCQSSFPAGAPPCLVVRSEILISPMESNELSMLMSLRTGVAAHLVSLCLPTSLSGLSQINQDYEQNSIAPLVEEKERCKVWLLRGTWGPYEFLCPGTKVTLIIEQDLHLETAQRIMPPLTPTRRFFSLAANGFDRNSLEARST